MNERATSNHFLDLYERAFRDVYSYVASRVIDRSTAEDVTQEVFITGARHVARGGDVDVAWLKTVAGNKLIDHWRARAREDRSINESTCNRRKVLVGNDDGDDGRAWHCERGGDLPA